MNQYFLEAFEGLDRLSPGSRGSTLMGIVSIPRDEEVNILEIGCGTGNTSILMAETLPKARIIATDSNQEYIRHLSKKATEQNLQIQGMVMPMEKLEFPSGQFDAIVAEGAIYIGGFEKSLEKWKGYLAEGGQMIFNDLCWLKHHVPNEIKDYWNENYPDIQTVDTRKKQVESLGYELISLRTQPNEDWILNYYKPLYGNLVKMSEKYKDNSEAQEVIRKIDEEMVMYSKYAHFYGYVMFALRKK